ncbi:MAG: hypothetical protein DRQ88_03850 [Epsilonproteobacteria bacterium]|nr:MAG: hypothetical protein DRQ89_04155 [Campylobacterota bacterium]RLA67171.1 MAG: hypothetical protein DRQ88_03850 [Campylobacterota bacterium]
MWKIILPLLFIIPTWAQNLGVADRDEAKNLLNSSFGKMGNTFFCECPYIRKRIKKCEFTYDSYPKRQKQLEWSHIVSPEIFGPTFISWNEGHPKCERVARFPSRSMMSSMNYSRSYYENLLEKKPFKGIECARKVNDLYRRMEADLYNIVPVIGAVNALKNGQTPAEIHIFVPQFGKCDLKIMKRHIDPPDELKGDVARIYFYMEASYPGRVSIPSKTKMLLRKWSQLDPVSFKECQRANKILRLQGNINFFVQKKCRN